MKRKNWLRKFILASGAAVAFLPVLAAAATPSRITAAIVESQRTSLSGSLSPLARAEFDQGAVTSSTQMTHMRMLLSRTASQQAALEKLIAEQMDPSSANYHRWLTPEELGEEYGPSSEDVAKVESWLQSRGFTVEYVSPSRTSIRFAGTAALVESAFQTSIHQFNTGTRQFYSNTTEPQIPTALTSVVSGVAHMNNLKPLPQMRGNMTGRFNPDSKQFEAVTEDDSASRVSSQLYYSGTSETYLFVTPGDAATIYDTPNSTFNANYSSSLVSSSLSGSGVRIGIGGDAYITSTPIVNYRTKFLGDSSTTYINVSAYSSTDLTTSDTSDADEAYLDMELAGAMAPKATISYYGSSDLFTAVEYAIDNKKVDIFSLSFGACEWSWSSSDNKYINSLWSEAASYGIAVTVSTGDEGSAGCDDANSETSAKYGVQINGLASTPYNVAVGGTDYDSLESNYSTYASTSNSSSTYYRTAKSYIPEYVWNDSTSVNTTLSANVGYSGTDANIWGGGGGYSSCSTNSTTYSSSGAVNYGTCSGGYSKPSWQTGTGLSTSITNRQIPDVSLLAADGTYGAVWLYCSATATCATSTSGSFSFGGVGGTSTSAPAFAGILALVQQYTGSSLGNAAQTLYELYNGSYTSSIYHDIGAGYGSNSVPCTSGTTNCSKNSAGYYFLTGYNATAGYDMATGLGSVDASYLVKYWSTAGSTSSLSTPTVTVGLSSSSITTSQAVTVTATVTGSNSTESTPTGTVSLSAGSTTLFSGDALSSGTYTFTIAAGTLSAGSYTLTVNYGGDTYYNSGSGTAALTVTASSLSTPTVTVTPAASSINSSTASTVTVAVTGSNSTESTPTGTVTLVAGTTTLGSAKTLSSGSYVFSITAGELAAGSYTLTATYSGDTYYSTGTGTSSLTVTRLTPTISVAPSATSIYSGQSLNVVVTASGSSSAESNPTGTVTLTAGSYSASASLSSGSYTFTIPGGDLSGSTSGATDTISVSYGGDTYYTTATGSATVSVTSSTWSMALSATSASVSKGTSTSSTITLASTTYYTGTVKLTCAVTTSLSSYSDIPTCSISPTSLTMSSNNASVTSTLSISTTASSASAIRPENLPGNRWKGIGGGAVLALLIFCGMPSRRRSWRAMVGALLMLAAIGVVTGCGGKSSSSNPGTSSGPYTVTVTGTGSDANTTTATQTFTLTVN